jgi:uncharacterized protein YeaO (DUF488 family)
MAVRRPHITVARVYDTPGGDGLRVLVDRVWPRGLRKEDARLDEWCKDVAPSTDLRKWYGHDPQRFDEFAGRYRDELAEPARATALEHLRGLAKQRPLVLLTATKEVGISQAAVLADILRGS